jgi:hypothetical protein
MKNLYIIVPERLGNFIFQVENAIKIALFYNYNIILPQHKYLKTDYIIINKNIKISDSVILDKSNFYYRKKIENIDQKLFDMNIEKTNEILRSTFNFTQFFIEITQPIFPSKSELLIEKIYNSYAPSENDLLIHIRSGDIFQGDGAHFEYITPPLVFYTDIIDNSNYNEIYLIAEDTLNPCIENLIKLYPKIKFKVQSLDEDIKLILSASNIIMSYGTFIPALLKFSDKIKNLYKASYCKYIEEIYSTINVYDTDLKEYKKLIGDWKNTEEQKKLMLTYQLQSSFVKNK